MSTAIKDMDCVRAIEQVHLYLDRELSVTEVEALKHHLSACEACAGELNGCTVTRRRLRSAIQDISVPAGLAERISDEVRAIPALPRRTDWQRWSAGIAAAVLFTIGVGVAYELGHLRYTAASQESYIGTVSRRVASIVRVGLGDHVHCAVFRKYPREAPPLEKIAADIGPEFLPLVRIVREYLPGDQRVAMAHRCGYHGRKFVHIAIVDGTHLSSLVIAERRPGETFQNSGLVPAMSDEGLPIYHSDVQRFQVDGFQTAAHLVYLVSDLPREANDRMMAKLAKPVHAFLDKLEL